jgi:NAD(P)-dependent dehydrogenase (short-subunit alcohol dehydrogenase family)
MTGQEFRDRVIVVTGAASGLGRETALAFAREGGTLAISDINAAGLEETATLIRAAGGKVQAVPADVSDVAACKALIDGTIAAFGRIDVLCAVAGMLLLSKAEAITPAQWDRVQAVNLRAPFFQFQAALPHLLASEGSVVFVASASAFYGHAYLSAYAASKAALVGLTKSLAMEYSRSPIRINAIAPGGMLTGMVGDVSRQVTPDLDMSLIGRFTGVRPAANPADLTDAILFLASSRAKQVHGTCFHVDQGDSAG